jgi:hypothetical protein
MKIAVRCDDKGANRSLWSLAKASSGVYDSSTGGGKELLDLSNLALSLIGRHEQF